MSSDALSADPFGEFALARGGIRRHSLLGGRFLFESHSRPLLAIVDTAYAGLPAQLFSKTSPSFRIRLVAGASPASRRDSAIPPLSMVRGAGLLGSATPNSDLVMLSPAARAGLLVVSRDMLRSPYHVRYEMLEFAVFTLATRGQGLIPLHAACISHQGRGLLLMGASGSGKSTLSLLCALAGLEFLAEDAVFVAAASLRATGVGNFLHVREESLRWIERARDAAVVTRSPVITRRSGIKKYEVDLRRSRFILCKRPTRVVGVIFLSAATAPSKSVLRRLSPSAGSKLLQTHQAYGANQPGWAAFVQQCRQLDVFELRRGAHPQVGIDALRGLLAA